MIEEDIKTEGCYIGIRGGGRLLCTLLEISTLILLPINKVPSNDKDRLVASIVSKSTKAYLTIAVVLFLTSLNGKKIQE